MGSAARMRSVAELVGRNKSCIVVLSAMSGVTDQLIQASDCIKNGNNETGLEVLHSIRNKFNTTAFELLPDESSGLKFSIYLNQAFEEIFALTSGVISEEIYNWLITRGEVITAHLFTQYSQHSDPSASLIHAEDFMFLNEQGDPDLDKTTGKLIPILSGKNSNKFITQGFLCRNHKGEISNLARGGSDYSATIIGAAVNAKEIEIWTDIDGLQNNDPRVVEKTFPVRELSFDEAAELAYFGAKILHPTCVLPARNMGIPIRIKNTFQPENPGTLISPSGLRKEITAIAAKDHITAIRVVSGRMLNTYGFLVQLFRVFEEYRTPIDMIATSEVSVSLTIDCDTNLHEIVRELQKLGSVEVDREQSIICVVGDFLSEKSETGARIFQSLKGIPIRMISHGGSQNNISFLVASMYKKAALNLLNKDLFTSITQYEYAVSESN